MTHFLSSHALPTTPLLLLLVLLCPATGHRPSTRDDLDQLILLFSGEFDNNVQNRQDTDSGLPSSEVHTFLRRLHVPVSVPALHEASGVRATTRQVYLETYLGETIFPNRQRILNFVLKDGVIEMETHAPRNASLKRQWERWRVDREIFRDLGADDLAFNPLCNVRWTRDGQSCFSAAILDNNCVFNFAGTQGNFGETPERDGAEQAFSSAIMTFTLG